MTLPKNFNLLSDILMSNNSIYAEIFNGFNLKNFTDWINWKWGTSKAKMNEMRWNKWMVWGITDRDRKLKYNVGSCYFKIISKKIH